jgi:hypothetical protein
MSQAEILMFVTLASHLSCQCILPMHAYFHATLELPYSAVQKKRTLLEYVLDSSFYHKIPLCIFVTQKTRLCTSAYCVCKCVG